MDSNFKFRLDIFLIIFHLTLIPMMIVFDFSFPKHFINQTYNLKMTARAIYILILIFIIISFLKFYQKTNIKENSSTTIGSLIKFPLIIYIFFISDEPERLYMSLIILPVFYFFSWFYKKFDDKILKLLCGINMIMWPDIIYSLTKGTYSFDVSLKVCVKSIGDYPDQTPIFTGFLMGTHKLRFFILSAGFILENLKFTEKFLDKNSYNFILLMDLQLTSIIISYFYYLYQDYEQLYLNIFIWAGTKCVTVLIVYLVLIINFFKNGGDKLKDYKKIKENTDDEIKII